MARHKAAVVGLGQIGQEFDLGAKGLSLATARSYAGAFSLHPRFSLAAGCDPNAGKRRAFERRWGGKAYASLDELLRRERPAVLAIACSTRSHRSAVASALRQSPPPFLILEKPFCGSVAEARAAARAIARAGAEAVVNYSRRWLPALRKAADAAASGRLGVPRRAVAYYTKGLIHNGSHMADLVSWLQGPLSRPRALARRGGAGADARLDAAAKAGGADAYFVACEADDYSLNEADLLFSRGRLRLSDNGRTLEAWRAAPNPWAAGARRLEPDARLSGPTRLGEAMRLMLDEVAARLDGGPAPRGAAVTDALAVLEYCEKAGRSRA